MDSPGRRQAQEAVDSGAACVIVAGGDGTVRQVARSLARTRTAVGILPTGTANLFALNLGLRRRRPGDRAGLRRDVRAALAGRVIAHDVGRVRWQPPGEAGAAQLDQIVGGGSASEGSDTEVFLAAAGIGMDAATVAATSEAAKNRLGWLAYLATGAKHLREPPLQFRLTVDGQAPESVTAWSILLGNTARIPAGITVFPGADSRSRTLEMLRTAPVGPLDWVSVAVHGLRRRPELAGALQYRTVEHLTVEPQHPLQAKPQAQLQLDGDAMGAVHRVECWVDPACLRVLAPPAPRPDPSPGAAPSPPTR